MTVELILLRKAFTASGRKITSLVNNFTSLYQVVRQIYKNKKHDSRLIVVVDKGFYRC